MTMAQQDLFIESKVEQITPQLAARWLEAANLHNRPLSVERAQALAGAIKRGEWALNGDAIRFSQDGALLDGQHRLQACVLAGKPIWSLVVRGLASNTFSTIDTNRAVRSSRDVMALSGINHYAITAGMSRLTHYYELTGNPYEASVDKNPSVDQLLAIAQRPGYAALASEVYGSRWCKKFVSPALLGFAMYTFTQYREEHAKAFFHKLENGAGLEEGSPILLLRERFTTQVSPQERLRPIAKGAYLFKAFRLYLLGANVKQLKLVFSKNIPLRDHFLMERRGEGG